MNSVLQNVGPFKMEQIRYWKNMNFFIKKVIKKKKTIHGNTETN